MHWSIVLSVHDWRIPMTPLIPAKTLRHGLPLISAVFLLQANNVFGAEPAVDAQMQARDLLSGTAGGRVKTFAASPAIPTREHETPSLDPQEQARELILGKPSFGGFKGRAIAFGPTMNATPAASRRDDRRRYADPQESARRMILGKVGEIHGQA
jgi:hypothetical protein